MQIGWSVSGNKEAHALLHGLYYKNKNVLIF